MWIEREDERRERIERESDLGDRLKERNRENEKRKPKRKRPTQKTRKGRQRYHRRTKEGIRKKGQKKTSQDEGRGMKDLFYSVTLKKPRRFQM